MVFISPSAIRAVGGLGVVGGFPKRPKRPSKNWEKKHGPRRGSGKQPDEGGGLAHPGNFGRGGGLV